LSKEVVFTAVFLTAAVREAFISISHHIREKFSVSQSTTTTLLYFTGNSPQTIYHGATHRQNNYPQGQFIAS
jgi:hypothetical protein